ncbi:MAG: DUF2975 domain-containing protein [Chitinophagaceae bacterium]|nr:DUF2975 domain-containing protein [Chitinophagaceae bacterium]
MTTKQMLRILHILAWILFVGLGVEAGGFIVCAFFAAVNPAIVKNLWLWQDVDLSGLFSYPQHFLEITILMSITGVLKAVLFYLVVTILYDKKLDSPQPFSPQLGRFLSRIAYLSLLIGLCCRAGSAYAGYLAAQGIKLPDIRYLRLDADDVWLFMGLTLLVIAQIFKRGVAIQSENELTV